MAVNKAFHTNNSTAITSEKNLYSDLVKEAIQIFGHDVYYIDRTTVAIDNVLGEDSLSKFTTQVPIEMYVENAEGGYQGEKELMSQFGLENRNEIIVKNKQIERQKKIIRSLRNRLNSEIEMHNRNLEYIHSLHAMKCNEWMITDSIEFPSYDYQKALDEEEDNASSTESETEFSDDDDGKDTLSDRRGHRTI